MDRRECLAPICDTLSTTAPEALRNLQPSTSTLRHETVKCKDEEPPCSNNMYPSGYLESPEHGNCYDSKDNVLEKLKKEFPEDECPQSSFGSKLLFEDEEMLKINSQRVKPENTETVLSLNIREEDEDKNHRSIKKMKCLEVQGILDNTEDTRTCNNVLVTTEEVQFETNARRTNSGRRPRVRGGRRPGRGVRTRGSRDRGAAGELLHPRPCAADLMKIENVTDLVTVAPQEQPLVIKKKRTWDQTYTVQSTPSVWEEEPVAGPSNVPHVAPSPAVTVRQPQRPLREEEIESLLFNGSESESDGDDVSEFRLAELEFDTPVDPEGVQTHVADESNSSTYQPSNFYSFEWKRFPDSPIPAESRRENFSNINVGPTVSHADPYAAFTAIWDRQIMEHIASETNKYAQQLVLRMLSCATLCSSSRISHWKDTCVEELYVYFAILLAMGSVIKTKVSEYWNTDCGDIFSTPGFGCHMSLRRFELLNACLHFNDNRDMWEQNLDDSEAKLFKLKPIITHLNSKFSSLYNMCQNIALDESLLQWKGLLSINQFIPNKAASVGIKTYEICESRTGYLWRFEIHTHKKIGPTSQQLDPLDAYTPATVLRLLQGLEHKGHTVWMDNFYNSPALARKLKTLGFDCVGTLRTNRQFVPHELNSLTKANMQPGQIAGFTSGDVDVLVWRDKNRVAIISTYHGNTKSNVNCTIKPTAIYDYNIMMGGVDKKDQMLAMFPIERKRTRIWYKKVFRRLLNVSVLNAYILLKQSTSASTSTSHRGFRMQLVRTILEKYGGKSRNTEPPQSGMAVTTHYLEERPMMESTGRRLRRVCCVCKKLGHLYCVGCDKTVCMSPCFVTLHTL